MAKTKANQMPDLSNATPGMLIDEIGSLREKIKPLQELEKYYATALKARLEPGQITVTGDSKFDGTVSRDTQVRINADLAREKLTPEQVASISKTVEVTTIRTIKKANAVEPVK